MALDKQDGSVATENLKFSNLGDFGVKNLVQQSSYLRKLNIEREMYLNIIKQLKTHKTLKTTLDNEETRAAFVSALKNFVKELDQ